MNTPGCTRIKNFIFLGQFLFKRGNIIINERHILIEGEVNPQETPIKKNCFPLFHDYFLKIPHSTRVSAREGCGGGVFVQ